MVSRELVSHGTVGLVLFWFGRCVEAMYVELRSVVVRHGRQGESRCVRVSLVWVRCVMAGEVLQVALRLGIGMAGEVS